MVAVLAAVITLLFLLGHRVNAGRVLKAREDNGSSRRAAVAERATLVPALMQLAGRVNRWGIEVGEKRAREDGPKKS